jgi:hypothetical protein
MSKVRKIVPDRIRKITGGKDPARIIEEFLIKRGFDPEECLQQRTSDIATWSVALADEEELEITLEGLSRPSETTLYMGINVLAVPIANSFEVLTTALIIADILIGAKLSLVNYDLVLSITEYADTLSLEEVDYFFELIIRQKALMHEAITNELGLE